MLCNGCIHKLDFFLFYVLGSNAVPMFFLIGVWGGENREYAAIKFFLYTFAGSVLMLVGMIALYFLSGKNVDSFNILALQGGKFSNEVLNIFGATISFSKFFFIMLFIGFAIKVPVFPFHTWLPHAHVQAPTAVSVILAGVLLKMGTYGFLRIAFPIFPEASVYFKDAIAWLGLVNIIYGALCAMAQTDVKKLIAYSSVSHMGFVMVGLAAMTVQGTNGAVLQMFNYGCSTAMILMIGILYERSHHRWIVCRMEQKALSLHSAADLFYYFYNIHVCLHGASWSKWIYIRSTYLFRYLSRVYDDYDSCSDRLLIGAATRFGCSKECFLVKSLRV